MKLFLSLLLTFSAFQSFADQDKPPQKDVVISVHEALVPEKVKAGEPVRVVLSGMFPNSCYRWSRAEVRDSSPTIHVIQAHALVTQAMCLMVLVPYSKEISMNPLARGEHRLRFLNGDDTYFERTVTVE